MDELKHNMKIVLIIFVTGFLFLIGYFAYAVYFHGAKWFENSYNVRIQTQEKRVATGNITDRNGEILASTKSQNGQFQRVYEKGSVCAHVVGYDNKDFGRAGAELTFVRYLLGFNDNLIDKIYQAVFSSQEKGDDVQLTLDYKLQQAAYDAMQNVNRGAAVVMNAKTGEVLAMVSKPDFDPNDMSSVKKYQNDPVMGILRNRAIQGNYYQYQPGSTFKIVTASSALKNVSNISSQTFNCTGSVVIGGRAVNDYNKEKHGQVGIVKGFEESCNSTFARIGIEIGKDNLKKTAEDFGFNDKFSFSDFNILKSNFQMTSSTDDHELAWDAIGQGKDTVTPIHMAMIAGSIVNGGVMMQPKLLKSVKNTQGFSVHQFIASEYKKAIDENIADQIKQMMIGTVREGTCTAAQVGNHKIGGKSGTAETGRKNEQPDAWFVGFLDGDTPISIAVISENSGTGGAVSAPIARHIIQEAIRLGY